MSAKLTYIIGRAGAGKSRALSRIVTEAHGQKKRVFLIVPEQFTFETERELSEAFGEGLMGIFVHSFTTLCERVMEETGERSVFLSPQGRRMVIRRAALQCQDELAAFSKVASRPGFSQKCDELFELCARFNISPEALCQSADALPPESLLAKKLRDLALLYASAAELLRTRGMSGEDAFLAMMERMEESSLQGATVCIDGFDLMTEQLYGIIGKLMDISCELIITIRCDLSEKCRDERVFAAEKNTYARIEKEARARGCKREVIALDGSDSHFVNEALVHLEREAFAHPFHAFDQPCEGITLFAAADRMAEAEAVCDRIIMAAKEGIRYRDMAIVASDMGAYASPVSRALKNRGIPFFTDEKHPLSAYPASRLILYALCICARGFGQKDVLETLKTGLCGVTQDEAERFENYVLMFGIRNNMFLRPFEKGEMAAEIEPIRMKLIAPLAALREAVARARTVAGKTEALYAYMEELNLYESGQALCDALYKEGRFELMEENAQVCNMIMELLSQLYAIMHDIPISTQNYAEILKEGLLSYEVGAIPPTTDQVLFGSVGRTRARSLRAMFIVGATEGMLPRFEPDDSLIDDAELDKLAELGLTPWDNSASRASIALADVYSAITKPKERLYISYPLSADGEATVPSSLIDRMKALFPDLHEESDIHALGMTQTPDSGFSSLARRLRQFADTGELFPGTEALYSQYYWNKAYRDKLALIENALYHNNSPEPFGRELALELYGDKPHGSASRLETFNACPFRHFARYGLRALPRKEYREQKMDEGAFCHDALDAFTKALLDLDKPIAAVTEADCAKLLKDAVAPLLVSHNNGILLSSARFRARARRLDAIVRETALAIVRQLKMGKFTPLCSEAVFGDGEDAIFPPIMLDLGGGITYKLSGKIDRLDVKRASTADYYRVIDYKGHNRTFSFDELYHGLSLQLPLYISAVLAANKAARAAGMYYQTYGMPSVDENKKDFEAELNKQFRLYGLTLSDAAVAEATGEGVTVGGGELKSDEMGDVITYAIKKAAHTAKRILEGEAEASPIRRRRKTACDFCDYTSLCRFDIQLRGCAYRNISRIKKPEFMERAKSDEVDA